MYNNYEKYDIPRRDNDMLTTTQSVAREERNLFGKGLFIGCRREILKVQHQRKNIDGRDNACY